MVDASVPAARVRAYPILPAGGAVLPLTLRLDPPIPAQPLWRFALIGLVPLGVMGLIAAGVVLGQWLGS